MWTGYEACLKYYMDCMLREWVWRGFKNTMPMNYEWTDEGVGGRPDLLGRVIWQPPWLNDLRVINSHRSNLLRKDPEFYGKYRWTVPDNLPYYWPVTKEDLSAAKVLELCP